MNSLQILIVDDEPKIRKSIRRMLNTYCPKVNILGEAGSANEAYSKIQSLKPNLILLDVQMPHGTGFDLLNRFKKPDFKVIFITGYSQYAIKAFKYHAISYLLKPLDIDELCETIQHATNEVWQMENSKQLEQLLQQLQIKKGSQVTITTQNGRSFVDLTKIIHCEADGSYTWIFLSDGQKILSTKNLGEYERYFNETPTESETIFYRIHHKHLINLQQMKSVQIKNREVIMSNEAICPIAQRRYSGFLELLKKRGLF